MLSGRYPSDEFAELRPRITWDRTRGTLAARDGAKRVAIANGGTIPDRGLYGVFLAGATTNARVGELDEEMVFETTSAKSSSWARPRGASRKSRTTACSSHRRRASRARCRSGRRSRGAAARARAGDRPTRCTTCSPAARRRRRASDARARPGRARRRKPLAVSAGRNCRHRRPSDATTIVVQRVRDDLGDWRMCVLSPRGGRVHAPWAMAAAAKIREANGHDVETLWADDGFVVRYPESKSPRIQSCSSPIQTKCSSSSSVNLEAPRSSPRSFARTRPVLCCCPSGGPACARRSGSSARERRTSWRWPPSSDRFPSCSKRIANACVISSTCRRWSARWPMSAAGKSG